LPEKNSKEIDLIKKTAFNFILGAFFKSKHHFGQIFLKLAQISLNLKKKTAFNFILGAFFKSKHHFGQIFLKLAQISLNLPENN